jgi:quinoprotein glucose dehydrogenase
MIAMDGGTDSLGPQGLPLLKPPYRRITAIDLNKGEIAWQKPFGWGPVDHPLLKDLDLGPLGDVFPNGVIAEGGILLTKSVLVSFLVDLDAEGNAVSPSNSRLQAYDKSTGENICDIAVNRHLHGSPMTCSVGGEQFILVAGGGVTEPAELIAFSLPIGP